MSSLVHLQVHQHPDNWEDPAVSNPVRPCSVPRNDFRCRHFETSVTVHAPPFRKGFKLSAVSETQGFLMDLHGMWLSLWS